jgi:hypothetical protein
MSHAREFVCTRFRRARDICAGKRGEAMSRCHGFGRSRLIIATLVILRIMIIPKRDYHCSLPRRAFRLRPSPSAILVASTLLSETPVVSSRLSLYRERVKVTVSRRDASSNPGIVCDSAERQEAERARLSWTLRPSRPAVFLALASVATTVSASPIARKHRARVPAGERTRPTNFPKAAGIQSYRVTVT